MTPKQKAFELMERFKKNKKHCVICANQVLLSGPTMPSSLDESYWIATESAAKFWGDVKKEIKKLK